MTTEERKYRSGDMHPELDHRWNTLPKVVFSRQVDVRILEDFTDPSDGADSEDLQQRVDYLEELILKWRYEPWEGTGGGLAVGPEWQNLAAEATRIARARKPKTAEEVIAKALHDWGYTAIDKDDARQLTERLSDAGLLRENSE